MDEISGNFLIVISQPAIFIRNIICINLHYPVYETSLIWLLFHMYVDTTMHHIKLFSYTLSFTQFYTLWVLSFLHLHFSYTWYICDNCLTDFAYWIRNCGVGGHDSKVQNVICAIYILYKMLFFVKVQLLQGSILYRIRRVAKIKLFTHSKRFIDYIT